MFSLTFSPPCCNPDPPLCMMLLVVGGEAFQVLRFAPEFQLASLGVRLREIDGGAVFDVMDTAIGFVCTCGDPYHVPCAHIRALLEVGLLPPRVPQRPAPVREAPAPPSRQPAGCARDIQVVLRDVGHRLTTTDLLREMVQRGLEWAESTVKSTLGVLVDLGDLDNCQKTNPRGYGLPEWNDDAPEPTKATPDRAAKIRSRRLCDRCFDKPNVRELYPVSAPLPATATTALPGSEEKLRVMEQRISRGEAPFHPDDSQEPRRTDDRGEVGMARIFKVHARMDPGFDL